MKTSTQEWDREEAGFTLVEILVSMAILTVLLLTLVAITDSTRRTWTYTTGKIEQFREAREAFESISRRVSQATLNTYLDYDNPAAPTKYIRQSELRFISGPGLVTGASHPTHSIFFQAPLGYVEDPTYVGMDNLLNTWGYYIEFGDDSGLRPPFLSTTIAPLHSRFRLMELMEPSESLTLYSEEIAAGGNANYTGATWFTTPLATKSRVLAENIIALILLPKLSPQEDTTGTMLAPNYAYDSTSNGTNGSNKNYNTKNQLPPVVQITMVALDEASFGRLQGNSATMPALGLDALFSSAGDTQNPANAGYARDLQTLETTLRTLKLNYHIFTTNVSLKGAKWSREQTN